MNQNNPANDLKKLQREFARFIGRVAPNQLGKVMVQHTKKAFETESYEGKPWKARKKKNRKGKRDTKILVDTGRLKKSIDYDVSPDGELITLYTDEDTGVYGQVHNEGWAGRGAGFTMPKRQFMPIQGEGVNKALETKMKEVVKTGVNQIMSKFKL